MIVEFMGCSGAGKSTLATGVVRRLREAGLPNLHHHARDGGKLRTLAHALETPRYAIPILLDERQARLWSQTWRVMHRRAPNVFWRAARGYAAARIVGTHATLASATNGEVQIVDEGLLVTIQLAFSGLHHVSRATVEAFVETLPLPDVVVWVDAPLEILVQRNRSRPDPPRELRRCTVTELRSCLANARRAYRLVAGTSSLRGRLLAAWNPSVTPLDLESEMDRVAQEIRARVPSWRA